MSFRRITRGLVAGVGLFGCAALMTIGAAGVAGADAGVTLTALSPNSPSGSTVTPGTPFSSGQTVTVSITAAAETAAGMTGGSQLSIEECAAPGGVDPASPAAVGACDGNTHQSNTATANLTTGLSYGGYPLFALPDANLAEGSDGAPVCDLTHECVLYIGQNQNSASAPHLYSQPFFVDPGDGSDSGANPGDGLPEVPLAVGLPLAAAGLFGGSVLYRRRRSSRANAA